jgi:hypothetical protein
MRPKVGAEADGNRPGGDPSTRPVDQMASVDNRVVYDDLLWIVVFR